MTPETLKQLIEIEFDRCETISQFKSEVFRLIDIYEQDRLNSTFTPTPGFTISEPASVPYNEICPCNPKNGGSGMCGCTIGNKIVPNPKKPSISDIEDQIIRYQYAKHFPEYDIDPTKIIPSDPIYRKEI